MIFILLFIFHFKGKSTVIRRVLNAFPEKFGFSVSHTTREPRPGEENGTHYHFVTKDQMEDLILKLQIASG